mmetsp:Transcript_66528/g.124097  ORF Transcript_66528/g.124097 Transcript_66528/m.124097 type:complete len:341 (+) Transcript_66528:87-1109(+)
MKNWFAQLHKEVTGNDHTFKQEGEQEKQRENERIFERRGSAAFLRRRSSLGSITGVTHAVIGRAGSMQDLPEKEEVNLQGMEGRRLSRASLPGLPGRRSSAFLHAAEALLVNVPFPQPVEESSSTTSAGSEQLEGAGFEAEEPRVDSDRVAAVLANSIAWNPASVSQPAWGATPPGTPPCLKKKRGLFSQAQPAAQQGGALKSGITARLCNLLSHPELNGTLVELLSWDADVGRWVVALAGFARTGRGPRVLPENLIPLLNEMAPRQEDSDEVQPAQPRRELSNYLTSAVNLPGSETVRSALPSPEMEEEIRARIRQASDKWQWVTPKDQPAFYAQREAV